MSGALDEDTVRTLNSGRETIGSMLSSAQGHLKKVFVLFVVVMLATIYGLQLFIWDAFKRDLLYAKMDATVSEATEIIAVTPFDVILLQVKIGLLVGVLASLPALVYYSRGALKQRGIWPDGSVPRWKLALAGSMILLLMTGGFLYAYELFFPIMFNFLADNAVKAGFEPTYSIVKWTEFIFLLGLSFGLAAQLPIGMSGAAAAGIVRYETFRDKWRYAVVGIFAFGAIFSPPDPFTQIMWAVPLVTLYGVSLGITKLVVLSRRAGQEIPVRAVIRERWNLLAGAGLLGGLAVYVVLTRGGLGAANRLLALVGSSSRLPTAGELGVLGLPPAAVAAAIAAVVGSAVAGAALFYFRIVALEQYTGAGVRRDADATAPSAGDPAEIDLDALDAPGVEAAPIEVFAEMTEDEAVGHARRAIDEDDSRKARIVLDRFDEAQERAADSGSEDPSEDDVTPAEAADEEASNPVASTAAGMADAFTEDETTEDDIGGYYYDIRFIVDSLTSKAVWIVGVFMAVLGLSFAYLYRGGIGDIKNSFLRSMPEALAEEVNIVTLHPVEALIFEVKFSTLLAFVAIIPLVLYFAWPALEERGFASGDRGVLGVWGGTLVLTLVGGSLVGFFYIAPAAIGWLATDALTSAMVIAYRINNFGWLVIFTTIGVGILVEIPVTMFLFHRGGIVSYATMRRRWRTVVLGLFAAGGTFSPQGVFTMLLLAVPASLAYGVGLGLLWMYTRVTGTTRPRAKGEAAD